MHDMHIKQLEKISFLGLILNINMHFYIVLNNISFLTFVLQFTTSTTEEGIRHKTSVGHSSTQFLFKIKNQF